jgi:hypothetical protein
MMYHVDSLAVLDEDSLHKISYSLNSKIRNLLRNRKSSGSKNFKEELSAAQIEYCYVYRELEVRESRKNAHQEYIKNKKQRAFS